jgi:hypothetical protein
MKREKDTSSKESSYSSRIDHNQVVGDINVSNTTIIRNSRKSTRTTAYPQDAIGSNLLHRNYIRYLVQRYHTFREADSSYGRRVARFSYAVIFKNIERKFKVPTYFVPDSRFEELCKHLKERIDNTVLGRNNRAKQIRSYADLDEFAQEQRSGESIPNSDELAASRS